MSFHWPGSFAARRGISFSALVIAFMCPTGSRAFRGPVYQTARKAFELKCAAYRLPETFYRA